MEISKVLCSVLVVAWVVAAAMHFGSTNAAAAISCGDAVSALTPCGGYLLGTGETKPSTECCGGVQRLNSLANTLETRRALCECLKETGPSFGVNPSRARTLPSMCKVDLRMPVSVNMNCNKIQ